MKKPHSPLLYVLALLSVVVVSACQTPTQPDPSPPTVIVRVEQNVNSRNPGSGGPDPGACESPNSVSFTVRDRATGATTSRVAVGARADLIGQSDPTSGVCPPAWSIEGEGCGLTGATDSLRSEVLGQIAGGVCRIQLRSGDTSAAASLTVVP